jgi:hypothetical protein
MDLNARAAGSGARGLTAISEGVMALATRPPFFDLITRDLFDSLEAIAL